MPRLNTSLSPQTFAAIRRFSESTGDSMSSVVAEMLDLCAPSLVAAADALERAKASPHEVTRGMLAALHDVAVAGAVRGGTDADRVFQALSNVGNPLAASETPSGAAAAKGRTKRPPPSNTGVRSVDNSQPGGKGK
jgi:hypothetical protein